MAFDVLFNFLGNVENLRAQLAGAKADLFETTNQLEAKNRELLAQAKQAAQEEADARRAAYKQISQAEREYADLVKYRQAIVKDFQDNFVNAAGNQRGMQAALNNELRKFDMKAQIDQTKQAAQAASQLREQWETGTAAAQKATRAAQEAVNEQVQQARQQVKNMTEQNRLLQEQTIQATRSRMAIASAGFALQQSGLPGANAIATPLIGYGFQGIQGAIQAGAVEAVVGLVKGFTSLVGLVKDVTTQAYEFSQELQRSRIAMAGIIAQTAQLVDARGNVIPDVEKFNAALEISKKLQNDILAITLKTNVTFKEGQQAVQSGLGYLLNKGVDPTEAANVIIRLTSLAKGLGIEGSRAAFQIRSALNGTRSQLTALLQSSGFDVKSLFKNFSGQELADQLNKATQFMAQGIAKTTDLLQTQIENIKDTYLTIIAQAIEPATLRVSQLLSSLLDAFQPVGGKFKGVAKDIQDAFTGLFDTLASGFAQFATPENFLAFVNAVKSGVDVVNELTKTFLQLASTEGTLAGFFRNITALLDTLTDHSRGTNAAIKSLGTLGSIAHPVDSLAIGDAAETVSRIGRNAGLTSQQIDTIVAKMADDFKKAKDSAPGWDAKTGLFTFDADKAAASATEAAKASIAAIKSANDAANNAPDAKPTAFVAPKNTLTIDREGLKNLAKVNAGIAAEEFNIAFKEHPVEVSMKLNADLHQMTLDRKALTEALGQTKLGTPEFAAVSVALSQKNADITTKLIELHKDLNVQIQTGTNATSAQVDAQQNLDTLIEARERIYAKQAATKEAYGALQALRAQGAELDRQLELDQLKLADLRNIKAGEEDLAQIVRQRADQELQQAALAVKLAKDKLDAQTVTTKSISPYAGNAYIEAQKKQQAAQDEYTKALDNQVNKTITYQQNVNSYLAKQSEASRTAKQSIIEETDALRERNLQLLGVDQSFVAEAKFRVEIDKTIEKLQKQKQALIDANKNTTVRLASPNISNDAIADGQRTILQNQVTISQTDALIERNRQLIALAEQEYAIRNRLADIQSQSALVESRRQLDASRVSAGLETEITATTNDRQQRIELIRLEQQRGEEIKNQIRIKQLELQTTEAQISAEGELGKATLQKAEAEVAHLETLIKEQTANDRLLTQQEELYNLNKKQDTFVPDSALSAVPGGYDSQPQDKPVVPFAPDQGQQQTPNPYVDQLNQKLQIAKDEVARLKAGFADAAGTAQGLRDAINKLNTDLNNSNAAANRLSDWFQRIIQSIQDQGHPALAGWLSTINDVIGALGKAANYDLGNTGTKQIFAGIQEIAQAFGKGIPKAKLEVDDKATSVIDAATQKLAAFNGTTATATIQVKQEGDPAAVDAFNKGTFGPGGDSNKTSGPVAPGASDTYKTAPGFKPDDSTNELTKAQNLVAGFGTIAAGIISTLNSTMSTARKVVNTSIDATAGALAAFGGPAGALAAGILEVGKQIFNFVADLFDSAAKQMAADIAKAIEKINLDYKLQNINMAQTIQELNAQLQQTYELENKRGGSDSAKKLQDQLNQEIHDLKKAQTDILDQFATNLAVLRLGQGYQSVISTVQDALKAIDQFIGAGGSLQDATEFMSRTLGELKQQLGGQIAQAQLDALNRAESLMSLEQQRADLIKSNEDRIRSILSQGLADRELTQSQQRAQALYAQNNQYDQQLASINDQIKTQQTLLNLDASALGIHVDLNNLDAVRAASLAIEVQQENTKLEILKEQMQVYQGIQQNGSGLFVLDPQLWAQLNASGAFKTGAFGAFSQNDINIVINANGSTTTQNLDPASAAGQELARYLMNLMQASGNLK